MRILNLTGRPATPDEVAHGVVEPAEKHLAKIRETQSFTIYVPASYLPLRAGQLLDIAVEEKAEAALLDGPHFFCVMIDRALKAAGIKTVYPVRNAEGKLKGYVTL